MEHTQDPEAAETAQTKDSPAVDPAATCSRYVVHGYCLVPMAATIEVEADSQQDALQKAREAWEKDKRSLLIGGSEDEGAAFDWEPDAQLIGENTQL